LIGNERLVCLAAAGHARFATTEIFIREAVASIVDRAP